MATGVELYTLAKTYPIISIAIGVLLFVVGFKWAKKIFWVLAIIVVIIGIIMFFI